MELLRITAVQQHQTIEKSYQNRRRIHVQNTKWPKMVQNYTQIRLCYVLDRALKWSPTWGQKERLKCYLAILHCVTDRQTVGEIVNVRVIGQLYSALLWDEPIARDAQIWPVIARGSHSFTCHPHTNHICLYSPVAKHHHPLAGTRCTYPRRDGQAEFSWVKHHLIAVKGDITDTGCLHEHQTTSSAEQRWQQAAEQRL